jgi:SH3-like domain-containing protein
MLRLFALFVTITIFTAPATAAAPVKARVPSGIGILLIHAGTAEKTAPLVIFREPSLGRVAEIGADRLPSLSQSVSSPEGVIPVIVTVKKSGWYRIIYDDSEREGWIEGSSSQQFYRWEELLRNRPITLIGGLRKEFYLLRRSPDISAEGISPLEKGSRVTALVADGDWIKVSTVSQTDGWIRWRDENGRLVIALSLRFID